jgi:hypothetical protein
MRGNKKLTFEVQADLHPASKNLPALPDGTLLPAAAAADGNRAIPLKLDAQAERTP